MGKLFNTNTWRAPLQLIDCWLPLPADRRRPTAPATAGRAVQRFARAGWLHREAANAPSVQAGHQAAHHADSPASFRAKALRQAEARRAQIRDTRLFLSGSMVDVCAELDRLAAQEQASAARAA